LDE
jgi:hypothetical protein